NAAPGALFGVFNVDGQPNKALFYFKDINGRVVDSFVVYSNVEAPQVGAVTPAAVDAGGSGFTLTVDGANFVNGSVVRWNGAGRPTNFVSATRLTADIPAADIAAEGSAQVTVVNPAPDGGTSNALTVQIGPAPPRLLTEEGTGRAVALNSVTRVREPFEATTPYNLSADTRTRVLLFAADVDPTAIGNISLVAAQAEDTQNRTYPLAVEFVGAVPGQDWLTQVIVILPAELANAGEVRVRLSVRGKSSNKAPLNINPSPGGGP
ncbi:MAG TPA: IPT/TIG domain-containing protein, partial [Pyrinomonadaceae bacterium]